MVTGTLDQVDDGMKCEAGWKESADRPHVLCARRATIRAIGGWA